MRQAQFDSPPLLLRQLLLLGAFAGIFATRHLWPALLCLVLLAIHQHRRIFLGGPRFAGLLALALALSFTSGFSYTLWRERPLPDLPGWAVEAASPSQQHLLLARDLAARATPPLRVWDVADNRLPQTGGGIEKDGPYRAGLCLEAKVAAVEGRADRNLRIILENLRPLEGNAEPWPGRAAFTWYRPLTPEGSRPLPPGTPSYFSAPLSGERLAGRPLPGETLHLTLRLREIRGLKNPGLWDIEPYWTDQGVGLRAWAQGGGPEFGLADGAGQAGFGARWRELWRQRVLAALPHEPGGGYLKSGAELIPALLFGDKFLMDSADAELFARSTLAHSLALSGLHLGYAAALGYFAVYLLYRLRPGLALRLPRRKAAVIGGAVPALAYLWLGGAPPSLLRAALMLAFIGWALFRSRPLVLADALLWAVAAILFWNPLAIFDLRLQLSALCIAALAWGQPLFSLVYSRLRGPGILRRCARGAALLLLSSLVIQLALAPLLVKSFGLYGLGMPLNVLWLPVLGAVVMPCAFLGLLAVILQLPDLAGVFFQIAAQPCAWLLDLLRWLDGAGGLAALLPPRPHWLAMLGFWFLLSLLPLGGAAPQAPRQGNHSPAPPLRGLRRSLKVLLALILIILPLLMPAPPGVTLRLLDVGQGQSVLLEWGARRLLIDGGGGSNPRFDVGREVVAASLAQNRLPRLDYLLASHLDADHAGGLRFVLEHVKTGYYADNGEAADKPLAGEIMALLARRGLARNVLRAGDVLDLGGGLGLEVLHPALPRDTAPADGNRNSLVLRLVWQGKGLALICGDVDSPALRAVLRREKNKDLGADLLILPHHGSGRSLVPDFNLAVAPRLALAAAGYGNSWNFPAPAVCDAFLQQGVPLLSTARSGQISVNWASPLSGPKVSTARKGSLDLD